jgi:hypothetical protein
MEFQSCYIPAMPLSVLERVRSLREEINTFIQENKIYLQQKGPVAESSL